MPVKAMDLFDAYAKSSLPKDHGYIVSSHFSANSAYSRYEIVSYANVKSIYPTEEGLTFQTDGQKIWILVEPPNYHQKGTEPYCRATQDQIPHRFSELDLHASKTQYKLYWSKKPVISYGSFTVLRPTGVNFSFVFFALPDVYESMQLFFEKTFNREAGVPQSDAKKVALQIAARVRETMPIQASAD